jgi:phage shock protein PspC (stress-responsive transcriptional regulator)
MNTTDVQDTLREMWATRPTRPRQGRQVAGVAAGIARRYDIDPVLVRVGFVVAALSGIGAGLYIAGWILLPEEPADPAAPAPAQSPRTIIVIGLAIAAMISLGSFFSGDAGFLLPTLAVAGLLFLLHRSRGNRGSEAPTATTATTPPAGSGPSLVKEPVDGEPPASTPPSWDPLGAAPFAWDLPEPSPPPPPPPAPRKLPVTLVTLGVALLAGAATAVVMLVTGTLTAVNVPTLLGVMLAVLGSGLVVGAFVRAGRGLIPFAVLLSMLTWGAVAAPLERWDSEGFDTTVRPATVAAVQDEYDHVAGDFQLDLRALDLTSPPGPTPSPVKTALSIGAGNVDVWVPPNADLTLKAEAGFGDVTFGALNDTGPGAKIKVIDDLGADGVRSGRPLDITIDAGAGNVEVHRG